MESNSLILGSIPGNSGGIHKTYEESIIIGLRHLDYRNLYGTADDYRINDPYKLYLYKKQGVFLTVRKSKIENADDKDDFVEYEIINLYTIEPEKAIVEIIDKKVLHRHLLDERMLLEKTVNKDIKDNLDYNDEKQEVKEPKITRTFYIVELVKNIFYGSSFYIQTEFNTNKKKDKDSKIESIPVFAIGYSNKPYLIEYFTHKKIYEHKYIVHNGLSYTRKLYPDLDDYKTIAYYSKVYNENPDKLQDYIDKINYIEQSCIEEYNEYHDSIDEINENVKKLELI